MRVLFEKTKQEKNMIFNGTCEELLAELGVNKEEVLVIKNNELIALDEQVEDDDEIRLLSVVSGG